MKLPAVILLKLKDFHSMLKSAIEELELCSIATDCAWQELVKCKKVLKPRTCPCRCTCTCKPCNDIDSCLRQLESNIQESNLDHHIKAIEKSVGTVAVAYNIYKAAHARDWDI